MSGVSRQWCFVMMNIGVFCGEGNDSDDGNGNGKMMARHIFFIDVMLLAKQ